MPERYSSKTLREIVRIVASRFGGMIVIFAVAVAATALATYLVPRTYRSEVQLIARPARRTNSLETPAPLRELPLFIITQRQIIMSDYVIATAMMRLEGKKPPQIKGGISGSAASAELASALKQWQEKVGEYVSTHVEKMRKVRKRIDVVTPGGPEATYSQTFAIRVNWVEESDEKLPRGVSSREFAARRAYEFANYLLDAYKMRYVQLESERTAQAARFLVTQALSVAKTDLDIANKDYHSFIKNSVKADLVLIKSMVGQRDIAGLETGEVYLSRDIQGNINTIEARIAELKALKSSVDAELVKKDLSDLVVPDAVTTINPTITTLESKIVDLKLALNALEPRYKEEYKDLRNARKELQAAREDLRKEMSKQSRRLQQELASLEARRKEYTSQVAISRGKLEELAPKVVEYERLINMVQTAQRSYDEQRHRAMEASTAEKLALNPVLVSELDRPYIPDPDKPHRPIVWLNMLIGVLGGLVLALIYAFLADHLDHAIKSVEEAERYLGAPVLASVPRLGRNIISTK